MKKYNTHTDVKTFEDACKVEKLDAKKVIPDFKNYPVGYRKAMIAHAKLIIIAHALNRLGNNGRQWKPDWNNYDQYKYYPWFEMGGSSGFRYLVYDGWFSLSLVGSRLCFKSRELAEYAGNQFTEIYKQFML